MRLLTFEPTVDVDRANVEVNKDYELPPVLYGIKEIRALGTPEQYRQLKDEFMKRIDKMYGDTEPTLEEVKEILDSLKMMHGPQKIGREPCTKVATTYRARWEGLPKSGALYQDCCRTPER